MATSPTAGEHDHPGEVAQPAQHDRCRRRDPFLGGLGQRGGPDEVAADGAGEGGVEDVTAQFEVEAAPVAAGDAVGVGQAVPLPDREQDGDDRGGVARRPATTGRRGPARARTAPNPTLRAISAKAPTVTAIRTTVIGGTAALVRRRSPACFAGSISSTASCSTSASSVALRTT